MHGSGQSLYVLLQDFDKVLHGSLLFKIDDMGSKESWIGEYRIGLMV